MPKLPRWFWICGGVGLALVALQIGYYVAQLYWIPPKHAETEISGYSIEMELVKVGPLPELTDKILTIRKGETILARRTYRREGWDGWGNRATMYFVRDGDELIVADQRGVGITINVRSGTITDINSRHPDNFKDYCFGQFVFIDGKFKWMLNEDLPIRLRCDPAPRPSYVPEMTTTAEGLTADAQRGQNFAGKIIELEGTFDPGGLLNKDRDPAQIVLKGVGSAEITCIPEWSERPKFRQLQPGQTFRLVGRVQKLDSRYGGSLDQCIITELGPIPGK